MDQQKRLRAAFDRADRADRAQQRARAARDQLIRDLAAAGLTASAMSRLQPMTRARFQQIIAAGRAELSEGGATVPS